MSNLKEIKQALSILESKGLKRDNITVLHCNTAYPTPVSDVNLNLVWDPPWDQSKMSEAAKLELNL